jgi:hypothetical protein
MKALIRSPWISWSIRVVLILAGLLGIAGFSFLEGRLYSNRRSAIMLANDSCFVALCAVRARREPVQTNLQELVDWEVDYSGARLAEMSLRYPKLVERAHYNLLVRVRDYRKKYGRAYEPEPDLNPSEVDRKIAEAITCLESIHNTNQWGVPTLDDMIEHVERSNRRR